MDDVIKLADQKFASEARLATRIGLPILHGIAPQNIEEAKTCISIIP
jgi:hypothetical protein